MTFDSKIKQVIGTNLKKYMERSDITPAEISRRLDVNRSSVTWWVQGRSTPTIERLEQLAEILHCQVSDFLSSETIEPDILLTGDEKDFIMEYRKADSTTKAMIDRLLTYDKHLKGVLLSSKTPTDMEQ